MAKQQQQSSPTLPCAQCGYENEPERVYCHNCGTKLDRSLLPKEVKSNEETLAETRKRVKKLTNPGQGLAELKTGVTNIFYAAVVAALYLFFMTPDRTPSREKEAGANLISVMIEDALASPAASVLQFTEADISQHMRNRVRNVPVIPGLDVKRSYALIENGKIVVGVEQDFLGFTSIFSTIEYEIKVEGGKVQAVKTGIHFNRLGFDPRIPKVDELFSGIWPGLKREQALLSRIQAVQVTKDMVIISLKAAAPAR